jgi:hypothetical protein
MLKINQYTQAICYLYQNDKYVGIIDDYLQLLDIQVQIKQQSLTGCYVIFENEKIFIESDGTIDYWPDGFYENLNKLYKQLFDF